MVLEKQIDTLIDAGWKVLESDFSEQAFRNWREKAYGCLAALLGKSHPYTKHFEHNSGFTKRTNILGGVGVLTAATMCQLEDSTATFNGQSGENPIKNHEQSIHTVHDVSSCSLYSAGPDDRPVTSWTHSRLKQKGNQCQGKNPLSTL